VQVGPIESYLKFDNKL